MNTSRLPTGIKTQSGYILIFVSVFLVILIAASAQFFYRSTDSVISSGLARDSNESLLLAESAMNHLLGRFANDLDSNSSGNPDKVDAGNIQLNKDTPAASLLSYMFVVSTAGTKIDNTSAGLLQTIANQESVNGAGTVPTSAILSSNKKYRIGNLFTSCAGCSNPLLYTMNNQGMLTTSTSNWIALGNVKKAAAWIEVTENPTNSNAIDLYIQTVAQVGENKSYLQRYIGSYFPANTLGQLPALAEASSIDRRK